MCFSDGDDNSTIAPECADPGFDIDAVDSDMSAIKNLYDRDLVREMLEDERDKSMF